MTGVAPCPGRSHRCPSNCPLLLELVIRCGCPAPCLVVALLGTRILFAAVAEGMLGPLRLDAKSQGPLEENGNPAKKGVERCLIGGVGVTAVYGDLVLNQSHVWLHFASTTGQGNWTCLALQFSVQTAGGDNEGAGCWLLLVL